MRVAKWRFHKFAWIFGASAIVISLLYWEQTAVLYVLSTLAMSALLLIVAFSNLEARSRGGEIIDNCLAHHRADVECYRNMADAPFEPIYTGLTRRLQDDHDQS